MQHTPCHNRFAVLSVLDVEETDGASLELAELPRDVLEVLRTYVGVKYALKLVCRALREAAPKWTTTQTCDVEVSVRMLEWSRAHGCTEWTYARFFTRRSTKEIATVNG